MTENKDSLVFGPGPLSEDGYSWDRDAYLIWAKRRSDGTRIRCLIPREVIEDHFTDENHECPSSEMLENLKDRLQNSCQTRPFTKPKDDFKGEDLILETSDF